MEESDSGQFGEFAKLLSRKTRVGSNPTSSAQGFNINKVDLNFNVKRSKSHKKKFITKQLYQ